MLNEHEQRQLDEQWNRRADRLEAAASKLKQRARDIRHTLALNATNLTRVKPLRCLECDAEEGKAHFGFCSYFGDGSGRVVE